MDTIKFYHSDGTYQVYAISSWYHKPAILCALANYANYSPDLFGKKETLFVCSSRFGCQQFTPKFSKSFPVHYVCLAFCEWHGYQEIMIEFNDSAIHNYGKIDVFPFMVNTRSDVGEYV